MSSKKSKGKKSQAGEGKLSGREGFEAYYSSLFQDRWPSLKEAFQNENKAVEFHVSGAEKSYFLDSASVLAALSLPLQGAQNILDLCAAPGGKTLVIASRMSSEAKLSSNERSPERKRRLAAVVSECLPSNISDQILVSCSDGATWCRRQSECFDRILLDAPCSSERHVFNDEKYLSQWSPSRIKTVAMEEWALLSSAYRLLTPQGIMVYSTCALCPQENDEMMERLIKKFGQSDSLSFLEPAPDLSEIRAFLPADFELPSYEKTKYGFQILPDRASGAGPIYFSIICKQKAIEVLKNFNKQ
ncbi:MAG: RsmB/NOP family class I SAM-dependent RNA methyltransferase [Treponema sp.]|nr:RsmB/NOP family class I SAM-dependent RNA methyltransferase [Treponema sp.]